MSHKTALIAGATGLVGGHLLRMVLASNAFDRIISMGRRPLSISDPRLLQVPFPGSGNPLKEGTANRADNNEMSAGPVPGLSSSDSVDVVFIALGTTIRKAGSQERFRAVDFDLVLNVARFARKQGAEHCLVVTALGADSASLVFYNRVKGDVEAALAEIGFSQLTLFRPSLLLGDRTEARPAEAFGQVLGRSLGGFMIGPLRPYRPIQAECVARALLRVAEEGITESSQTEASTVRIIESAEIAAIANERPL